MHVLMCLVVMYTHSS